MGPSTTLALAISRQLRVITIERLTCSRRELPSDRVIRTPRGLRSLVEKHHRTFTRSSFARPGVSG
jgi:hypothetical protein